MRRIVLLVMLAGALVLLPSSLAATAGISITSTGFHPGAVTVAAGDTVSWKNNDTAKHQVVANDGSFSSPVLSSGQTFARVFRSGGSFAFHDGLNPALKGTVTVIPPRTVWITSAGFQPSTMSIRTGESVTWVNKSSANQQVVADDSSFKSPVLASGATFAHTFANAGRFGYHDGLQPTLKGTVIVASPPPGESITLNSNLDVATYGGSLDLNGTVSNGTAGEKVAIVARPQTVAGRSLRSMMTVTTAADGSFSATVQPLIHTVYVAQTAKSSSDPLAINVRPSLVLAHVGRARAIVRASAIRSFLHRYALLQVRRRSGLWSSIARVRFTRVTQGTSPTILSAAIFRLHVRHGRRLRVFMPFSQARPGYISGLSNQIRS